MWQQSTNGPAIVEWTKEITGEYPTKVYPVLVNLYEPRMDSIVRGVYIEQLIEVAGLYDEPFWGRPQWLVVTDLEALAALADRGDLDLERLLSRKDGDEDLCREGFDRFLFQEFDSIPIDRKLRDYAMSHFQDAGVFFRENPES